MLSDRSSLDFEVIDHSWIVAVENFNISIWPSPFNFLSLKSLLSQLCHSFRLHNDNDLPWRAIMSCFNNHIFVFQLAIACKMLPQLHIRDVVGTSPQEKASVLIWRWHVIEKFDLILYWHVVNHVWFIWLDIQLNVPSCIWEILPVQAVNCLLGVILAHE